MPTATMEDPSSGLQQPQQATLIDRPISTVATTTFAVATPADLNTIPTVVAQLPLPCENDVELQNDESVPVAVATVIRGDTDPQQESEPSSPDCNGNGTRWRYRCRKEDISIAFLFCLLVLMGMNFVSSPRCSHSMLPMVYLAYFDSLSSGNTRNSKPSGRRR